ncbi:hypothetical protein [Flexistipes sp.]|uniref:hypothetical protein n=1 Tax=Flexistipes sp. TaxID=3088135 RepID=UPI002E1A3F67|nr:hypothetical protein [Flexistipes sp.]
MPVIRIGVKVIAAETIEYKIDKKDRINYIDQAWIRFARLNDCGIKCKKEFVYGMHIFDCICDPETRFLYQTIIETVRNSGKSVKFPFRCDSPAERRFLEMEISPLNYGEILFKSYTLKTEKRCKVNILAKNKEGSELITVCSMCKKIKTDKNTWSEVEDALKKLELFLKTKLPQLTHGLCPSCYRRMMDEIDKIK